MISTKLPFLTKTWKIIEKTFPKSPQPPAKTVPNPSKIDPKPQKFDEKSQDASRNLKQCEKMRKSSQHEPIWGSIRALTPLLGGIREALPRLRMELWHEWNMTKLSIGALTTKKLLEQEFNTRMGSGTPADCDAPRGVAKQRGGPNWENTRKIVEHHPQSS